MDAIDELCKRYPIDLDRIYIVGGSMGGYGTWDAICRFPDRFAGAIPISGGGDPSRAALLKNMPIHAFAIATDPICPVSGSRDMIEAIKSAGGQPNYTEFPRGWHLWDQVWDPKSKEYWQKDLTPWLFDQTKDGTAMHLRTTVEGLGAVVPDPTGWIYAPGIAVTLTPTPGPGWEFVSWSGDATDDTNPLKMTVNKNARLIAKFRPIGAPGVNLAFEAPISSDKSMGGTPGEASWANDGDPTTHWLGTVGDELPNTLTIAWERETTFDRVIIKAGGITSWKLEANVAGTWTEVAVGTSATSDTSCPPTRATMLRYTILAISSSRPSVEEFEVYGVAGVSK